MSTDRNLPYSATMRRRRVVMALIASGAIGTALPGCGAASSSSGASQAEKAQQAGLNFARCMRQHGVNVADPQPGPGRGPKIEISATRGSEGKVQQALAACDHFLKEGMPRPSPADERRMVEAGLKWAACMRRNGVSVPGPTPGQRGMMKFGPGPGGPKVDEAAFQRADAKCRTLLPGGKGGLSTQRGPGPGAGAGKMVSPAP
jgi:hypothetical protein